MNYLVTGGSGLIGSRFIDLTKKNNKILSPDEKNLDFTNKISVENYFAKNQNKFDVVINFAAYTNVDGAEKEKGNKSGIVWKLNVEGAEKVAKACRKYAKFLIHISTDFIFPGTKSNPGPYSEDSRLSRKMDKIGWYGWTKLEGEKKVRKINKNAAIVRTAYPFRSSPYISIRENSSLQSGDESNADMSSSFRGNSALTVRRGRHKQKLDFARNILALYDQRKLYPLFSDQKLTPVFIDDLVKALEKIARLQKGGVYHVVTLDSTSPYEFANYLLEKARGVKNIVKKGSMEEFLKASGRTPRPRLGGLKSQKTQKVLGMKFNTWKQSVDEFVRQIKTHN